MRQRGIAQEVIEKIKTVVGVHVRVVEQLEGKKLMKLLVDKREDCLRIIANSQKWVENGWVVSWWREGAKNWSGKGVPHRERVIH